MEARLIEMITTPFWRRGELHNLHGSNLPDSPVSAAVVFEASGIAVLLLSTGLLSAGTGSEVFWALGLGVLLISCSMAPGADRRDGHREAAGEIMLGPIPGRNGGHGRRRVGGRL